MTWFRDAVLGALIVTGLWTGATARPAADLPAVPASTGSKLPQDQAQAALDFHNDKRREVGVPPLLWSTELSAAAQAWADRLAAERQCRLVHKPDNPFGENLFGGRGAAWTALDASEVWHREVHQFVYAPLDMHEAHVVGHYTQMVWSTTTRLGMGMARCANGAIVIAAEYEPPGNIIGRTPY